MAAIPKKSFLFPAPPPVGQEVAAPLLYFPGGRVESILSAGAHSPEGFWYDQETYEWVAVVEGWAVLEFPDGLLELHAGECLTLPPHLLHRVKESSIRPPCRWLCVFYPADGDTPAHA